MKESEFSYDTTQVMTAAGIRCDWLYDKNCLEEEEMIRMQLGQIPMDQKRFAELWKLLQVNPAKVLTKRINMRIRGQSHRYDMATMILTRPLGLHYMMASMEIQFLTDFYEELRQQPVMEISFDCNGTPKEKVAQFLSWPWLAKVKTLEFRGWRVTPVELARVFKDSQINPEKLTLVMAEGYPTQPLLKVLPKLSKQLNNLKEISFNGTKYNYGHPV